MFSLTLKTVIYSNFRGKISTPYATGLSNRTTSNTSTRRQDSGRETYGGT